MNGARSAPGRKAQKMQTKIQTKYDPMFRGEDVNKRGVVKVWYCAATETQTLPGSRADEAEAGVAAMREALSAAREILSRNTDARYGHFHGGDPRSFFPDAECCTPEEMEAHRTACEAANRGEPSAAVPHRHDIEVLERDGEQVVGVASHPGSFGLGTTTMSDPEIQQALDKIDAALATNAGATFLARMHAEKCRADEAEEARGLAEGRLDAARANLAEREARLDNQNAGLVAMARQRDEARREVERLARKGDA